MTDALTMMKAFELASRKGPPPMACCPRCDAVLVSTFVIVQKEFVCVNCGGAFDFLSPKAREQTAELMAESWMRDLVWEKVVQKHRDKEAMLDHVFWWLRTRRKEWSEEGGKRVDRS